ncbi:MAG TPA: hypothetical protein DEQ14_04895 [Treponema sp.]|nr:hypothetical protein [Treponema sp.]
MSPTETPGKKAKKRNSPKIASAVIVAFIVLFAALIAITLVRRNNGANGAAGANTAAAAGGARNGSAARNATAVRVTEVVTATIENSVVINGDVIAGNQVSIFPTVAGKLVETRLGVGDRVKKGDVVAMIDPSRPGEVYSSSPVVSTISGTILQSLCNIGDTLSTQSAVYVVGDLSSLRVETFVPERFVSSIKLGLGANVRLESLPGEIFYTEVSEVSPVLNPASRTLRILLRFVDRPSGSGAAKTGRALSRINRIDDRIKAGMFATITLVTQTRENVPVIPRASVINTYGSWIVFTVDENNIARQHEVALGIENEEFFEALSGVMLGDKVVSAGQNFLSDGDPVRILE